MIQHLRESTEDQCDTLLTTLEGLAWRLRLREIPGVNDHRTLLNEVAQVRVELANLLAPDKGAPLQKLIWTKNHQKWVKVFWKVEGVPPKFRRADALAWLRQREPEAGDLTLLSRAVRFALEKGEIVPHANFGLKVQWTCDYLPYPSQADSDSLTNEFVRLRQGRRALRLSRQLTKQQNTL